MVVYLEIAVRVVSPELIKLSSASELEVKTNEVGPFIDLKSQGNKSEKKDEA